jgi:hypothetical protein
MVEVLVMPIAGNINIGPKAVLYYSRTHAPLPLHWQVVYVTSFDYISVDLSDASCKNECVSGEQPVIVQVF